MASSVRTEPESRRSWPLRLARSCRRKAAVVIDGVEAVGDTEKARSLGLAIVRQEPALMPELTVAENLYLGVPEAERPSLMDLSGWAQRLLEQWSDGVAIDTGARVLSLNPEQRFIVEIVKALAAKPKVLVLDEPTEHLLAEDVERLFERIRRITAVGLWRGLYFAPNSRSAEDRKSADGAARRSGPRHLRGRRLERAADCRAHRRPRDGPGVSAEVR